MFLFFSILLTGLKKCSGRMLMILSMLLTGLIMKISLRPKIISITLFLKIRGDGDCLADNYDFDFQSAIYSHCIYGMLLCN